VGFRILIALTGLHSLFVYCRARLHCVGVPLHHSLATKRCQMLSHQVLVDTAWTRPSELMTTGDLGVKSRSQVVLVRLYRRRRRRRRRRHLAVIVEPECVTGNYRAPVGDRPLVTDDRSRRASDERPLGVGGRGQPAPFPGNSAKPPSYEDDDAGADDDGGAVGGVSAGGSADPKQLEGVPGVSSLPAPTAIKAAIAKDFGREISVFGEYVMMCFHSSPWVLREAALQKIELDLESYSVSKVAVSAVHVCCNHRLPCVCLTKCLYLMLLAPSVNHSWRCVPQSELMAACCTVISYVLDKEKIAQVILTACTLLPTVVNVCSSSLRRPDLHAALENVLTNVLVKLGDTNARTMNAAVQTLMDLATMDAVGSAFVAGFVVRKVPKKQASAWKPLKVWGTATGEQLPCCTCVHMSFHCPS
jgi:hypothetical protein